MGLLIAAGVVMFFALVLWIIGIALKRQGKIFVENKRYCRAEVVGYERADQSDWYTLLVRIPDFDDGKIYSCSARKIDTACFPKGSVIDVLYAPRKVVGIKVVEVHLLSNPPADGLKLGRRIEAVSVAMFLVASILSIIGFITVL